MSYKKITVLTAAATLLLGSFAAAQTKPIEHSTNSIIAYFDADGALLPSRAGSEYYRFFNNIVSGCYLVQDFYSQNDQKQTNPICFTDPNELQSWFPVSMQGPLIFWSKDGRKMQEGYGHQDGGRSGWWREWDYQGRAHDYELINGELIISYFDEEGNRQPNEVKGGTFRTLVDYNPDQDVYIVTDYYTDTRTKQSDPVVIQRSDLLLWDIKYRDGLYAYYDTEGDLTATEQYRDGKLDGVVAHWYPNIYPAQKLEEMTIVDGKQEGLYVRWYSNGFPKIRMITHQGNISEIQCWDEEFKPLDSLKCPMLFQDAPEVVEYKNIENEKPIEIIIPDEEVIPNIIDSAKAQYSTQQDGKVKESTVIFPHDKNGEKDKSNVTIIKESVPAATLTPAMKINE